MFVISPLNDVLKGFNLKIPNKIFGLFELSDLQLIYHDNFIEGLVIPTFIPIEMDTFKPKFELWTRLLNIEIK